jgi:methanogenic corrinoid protein MtbC1
MKFNDNSEKLIYLLTELKEDEVKALILERLEAGDDPLKIMQDCQKGVRKVGILYEQRRYYLSGLIMAGEILQGAMELIQSAIADKQFGKSAGRAVIGTASGDIHDIGKDIVGMLLTCSGFTVYDLGVDVPPEEFLKKAIEVKPQIIGISALLSTTQDSLHETIRLLKSELKLPDFKPPTIIIGGGQLDAKICKLVGADAWVNDALEGIRICQEVIKDKS